MRRKKGVRNSISEEDVQLVCEFEEWQKVREMKEQMKSLLRMQRIVKVGAGKKKREERSCR